MNLDILLNKLWQDYSTINSQAKKIHTLIEARGEKIENDHIAFRTYNLPNIGIEQLAKPFIQCGYSPKGEYQFPAKKLFARHYEHAEAGRPRIFISELKVEAMPTPVQDIIKGIAGQITDVQTSREDFPVAGVLWKNIAFADYEILRKESEYAAWLAVFGFRANHFTVFVNALKSFKSLEELNSFLKEKGFPLNNSGGEIKGTPQELLEQSSTLGDPIQIKLSDRTIEVPGCYYEFARRYPKKDGALFSGFIAQSADKIFESTDNK